MSNSDDPVVNVRLDDKDLINATLKAGYEHLWKFSDEGLRQEPFEFKPPANGAEDVGAMTNLPLTAVLQVVFAASVTAAMWRQRLLAIGIEEETIMAVMKAAFEAGKRFGEGAPDIGETGPLKKSVLN